MDFWRGDQEGVVLEASGRDSSGGVEEEADLEMEEKDEERGEEGKGIKGDQCRKRGRGSIVYKYLRVGA